MADNLPGGKNVKVEIEEGIAWVTLNRPEKRNCMSPALNDEMVEVLDALEIDDRCGVLVLTGAGDSFSAGMDLREFFRATDGMPFNKQMRVRRSAANWQWRQLMNFPKPTIAMVNGPAIGAGVALALNCDFRVCSDAAFFNSGYANMALSGDIGISYLLCTVVGPARARELMLFPRRIDPEEALAIGLVTRVVPHARLLEETMDMARELATGPTLTFGHIKENIAAALDLDPRTAFDIEARNFIRCFQTEDHKEAVTAFKEKRPPVFKGR